MLGPPNEMALAAQNRPLKALVWSPIQVPKKARAFFDEVVFTEVGDETHTKFWKDKWLQGKKIADLAPRLFAVILKRIVNSRTVQEAVKLHSPKEDC
jgi:hypothetical protein